MADQGHFAVNHNIGQKQYELSNHLGNVQATVSDMPFIKRELIPGTDILAPVKEPALVSAYDYYPFGMLQPGRYVSDTTSQCLTVSRNRWVTTWISYCVPAWSPSYYTELGTATATLQSNNTLLSIQAESVSSGISLVQNVQPGIVNNVSLDIASMAQTGDDATIIQAVEMIGSDAVVLGSIPVTGKGTYRISFKPTGSIVQLWVLGAYDILLKPTCYTYPVTTQETYLVDICDENKDRYRFGFNGQEKVNELAGIGNHNTALFWEYDTRTGRRWNLDPVDQIGISNYAANYLNPIFHNDPQGDVAGEYYKTDGAYLGSDGKNDDKVYTASGISKEEIKDDNGNSTGKQKTMFYGVKELPVSNTSFNFMAQTLYAESSPDASKEEVAGIFSVCRNRANAYENVPDILSTFTPKYPFGVYGSLPAARARYSSEKGPGADSKRQNVRAGLILGLTSKYDYSNGGFWWDGTDFKSGGAHKQRYEPGYKFTSPAHDIFKQGSNIKPGKTSYGTWQYKYESTNVIRKTTFTKLSIEWRDAQLPGNNMAMPLGDNPKH